MPKGTDTEFDPPTKLKCFHLGPTDAAYKSHFLPLPLPHHASQTAQKLLPEAKRTLCSLKSLT
jgi:hypothetical protein